MRKFYLSQDNRGARRHEFTQPVSYGRKFWWVTDYDMPAPPPSDPSPSLRPQRKHAGRPQQ